MEKEVQREATLHSLEAGVQSIAEQYGIVLGKRLHTGKWYDGNIRSVVTEGVMKRDKMDVPVVVKTYEDPRPCDQPDNLRQFNADNMSDRLFAPQLIAGEATSDTSGWMIMEHIPVHAEAFEAPLEGNDLDSFLVAFAEYRKHFPRTANRELLPQEQKQASEFHADRLNRWKEYARESSSAALLTAEVIDVCETAESFIAKYYADQPMVWSHGHMKPDEVHRVRKEADEDQYWVTDFGHTALYPRGYEFAFIVWSNEMMHKRYESGEELSSQFDMWASKYAEIVGDVDQLDQELINAALAERILGTIYADTIAQSDISEEEKHRRLPILVDTLRSLIT